MRRPFKRMREKGELLEWARVFDNFYGTPRAPVEAAIGAGRDVLFDIDWQGAQQLSEKLKHEVVRVFILPPSVSALARAPERARAGPGGRGQAAHGGGLRRDQPLARV